MSEPDPPETDAAALPLPSSKHIPGQTERPDMELLEKIAGRALAPTLDQSAPDNPAWNYGIRLFNAGYYWEAHEVLEAVWMNALPNSRERYLVQGVIHVANARLKLKMAQPRATGRLYQLAQECFADAFASRSTPLMGISPATALAIAGGIGSEDPINLIYAI